MAGIWEIDGATANSWGWHINWSAVGGNVNVVRKYYYAGNQRIAMREDNVLRWLLGDHLGSTAYTVNGTTETSEVRYLPWGKDRFTSGQTVTSYRFTGQGEEAGLGHQGLKPLADNASWLKPNWGGGASPALADPYEGMLGVIRWAIYGSPLYRLVATKKALRNCCTMPLAWWIACRLARLFGQSGHKFRPGGGIQRRVDGIGQFG